LGGGGVCRGLGLWLHCLVVGRGGVFHELQQQWQAELELMSQTAAEAGAPCSQGPWDLTMSLVLCGVCRGLGLCDCTGGEGGHFGGLQQQRQAELELMTNTGAEVGALCSQGSWDFTQESPGS
jgi:hypothetical protein